MKKFFKWFFIILITGFIVIQFLPVSPGKTNPPVTNEIVWVSEKVENQFNNNCADCHSNNTKWPWYTYIAPVKWATEGHVFEGREEYNISTDKITDEWVSEFYQALIDGQMPPEDYMITHPEVKNMTKQEKIDFAKGIINSLGSEEFKKQFE